MELGHIVHQAETAAGSCTDHEIHKAHDTFRRFVKGKSLCGLVLAHELQQTYSLGIFSGEKTQKCKGTQIKAGNRKCIHRSTAARNPDDANPRFDSSLNQFISRIRDTWRTRIGDNRDVLPLLHLLHEPVCFPVLVELVVGNQAVTDLQLV